MVLDFKVNVRLVVGTTINFFFASYFVRKEAPPEPLFKQNIIRNAF